MSITHRDYALLALKGEAAVVGWEDTKTGKLVDISLILPEDERDVISLDAGLSEDLSEQLNASITCIGRLSTKQLNELVEGVI